MPTETGRLHRTTPGFGKSPIKMIRDKSISDGAARQYAYMHWRYGSNKTNFEGRASIAEALGISKTTVTNRNYELEQADWLVVIRKYNGRTKTTRNVYHLFESQADCIAWREQYHFEKPAPNEKKSKRKTRAGKGGNPTINAKTNVNSSSHRAVNSSCRDLDSSDLDSNPPIAATHQAPPDGDLTGVEKTPFKEVQTVIIAKWFGDDWANAGWAGKLTHMVMGTSEDKGYKEYNFDPPFDSKLVMAWADWMAEQGIELPTSPEKLVRWKSLFVKENAPPEPLPHIDYGGGGYAGQVAYVRAWYASEEGKARVREELEARGQYDAANS